MKCFAPHSRLSMASTRLLSKVGTLRQTYVRKHTFCKHQESFLNAHTPHFHLFTTYRRINQTVCPYFLQLRPTPIAKPHILFGRKALQATLPKTGTHRLPFVYNVKRRSSVFMSPTNDNHCVKKPAVSCAVSLPTLSLSISYAPVITIYFFSQSCHIGLFSAKVQVGWQPSNRASVGCFQKNLPLYVPYRACFSFPICLYVLQLLCMAEKYPSDKPKGYRKKGIE